MAKNFVVQSLAISWYFQDIYIGYKSLFSITIIEFIIKKNKILGS